MSRSVAWRRVCSDAASWHQDEATNATIYILREIGPTGFLLKEEGENKKFKVLLGDPHTCTCPVFRKEKDLCKHLCWVLLKKFRVPRQNPITWQLGLVEREINEILRGIAAQQQNYTAAQRRIAREAEKQQAEDNGEEDGSIKQREITEEDVCPICQEELLEKRLPVTYCKFGCGNNIHIKCMKVWAEHQKTMGSDVIKCPMCREDFGPFSLLQQEFRNSSNRDTRAVMSGEHLGTSCRVCHACPISGKCYKCSTCADYYLCQTCFNTPAHMQHSFEFRQKPNQRWRPANRVQGQALPDAVMQNLMGRDITEQDYDLLLQLDSNGTQALSDLTEETVRSLPLERVRTSSTLLQPGNQCRVCLRPYQEGQLARRLPCRHKFHKDCIDNWLLHQHATCPIDGTVYTNESVRQIQQANRARQQQQQQSNASSAQATSNGRIHPNNAASDPTLQIPGVGIARLGNSRVLDRHMNGVLEVSGINQSQTQNGGDRRRQNRSPIEPPESYVYTRSGDYIQFPNGTPNDIRLIQNAAARSRSTGTGVDNSSREQRHHVGSAGSFIQEGRAISFERYNIADIAHPSPLPAINNDPQCGSTQSLNNTNTNSTRLERAGGLDFTNLLMADIQRNAQTQQNDGRSGNQRHNQSTAQQNGASHRQARQQNNAESAPSINLTIGSITNEADAIGRVNRGQVIHGGINAAGRAALRRAQAAAAQNDVTSDSNHGDSTSLDIYGQTYTHANGIASSQASNTRSDLQNSTINEQSSSQGPSQHSTSIPHSRNNNVSLAVTGEMSAANKPPTGAEASCRGRGGRLRSKPLHENTRRNRSSSRDRASSLTRARQENGLFIGNDPNSISGLTSEFVVTTNENAATNHVSASRLKRGRSQGSASQSDDRYRWGATQNLSSDVMMLSGNSFKG